MTIMGYTATIRGRYFGAAFNFDSFDEAIAWVRDQRINERRATNGDTSDYRARIELRVRP